MATRQAGFGTPATPNSRIGTVWDSDSIWLRRSFEIDALPAKPALHLHHDEDVTVFLNGQEVARLSGWTNDYQVVPLDKKVLSSLRIGANVMVVHCRQTTGGQYVDVHFGDADVPPKLPAAKPFQSELITEWGSKVTAENAWTEYPRPQLRREAWLNLNGQWDYAVTPDTTHTTPEEWDGSILVPFCLESKLGGVQRLLTPSEALWYRTVFEAPSLNGERLLLNFEAVDYACQVLVNGQPVGEHRGGNTPFSIDVTDALKSGTNELIVRVEDDTEAYQLRGKQVLQARHIWYTRVSGIWQTVWLEPVPNHHIVDLNITTEPATGTITVRTETNKKDARNSLRMIVKDQGKTVATVEGSATELSASIPEAKLWSPESPHLYDLQIALLDTEGQTIDTVSSYAGKRSVGKARGEDGHLRLTLNGETRFHFGPLDQGWWPDGLLTPPSDEAMRFDIEYLKAAGFNTIRKHIKVEPRRYYYHCDRLGMMVWQDQVSAGDGEGWVRLREDFTEAEWPDAEHQQFLLELDRMIDHLESHPSIVMWVPFNESWGQHRTAEVAEWTAQRDPTRLVNAASGGNFVPVGDLADNHNYPHPAFPFDPERFDGFVKVVGEFGGHGLPVPGHQWDPSRGNWGYGGLPESKAEYRQRYAESLRQLEALRQQVIAAGIYTQTTDVEGEINGLMSYDRKVLKIPAAELRQMREQLLND